jgi:hypothetical protein
MRMVEIRRAACCVDLGLGRLAELERFDPGDDCKWVEDHDLKPELEVSSSR